MYVRFYVWTGEVCIRLKQTIVFSDDSSTQDVVETGYSDLFIALNAVYAVNLYDRCRLGVWLMRAASWQSLQDLLCTTTGIIYRFRMHKHVDVSLQTSWMLQARCPTESRKPYSQASPAQCIQQRQCIHHLTMLTATNDLECGLNLMQLNIVRVYLNL